MARLHCSSPIWPGLLALVLTSCFDDPPSLMESESSSGSGASTTTLTTSESTTTGEATDTLADTTDGTTGSESSGTGSESSSTGSESSSTGPGPECDADDGQPDEACTAGTPFCVGGSCVPCSGGGSCGALDPTTPVCGADDVCRPCVEHSECPNDAGCHLFEGTCLPADSVYYVNPDFMCGPGDATEAFPACSIQQAVAAVGADPEATIRLVENVYLEPMTIANGQVLAVLGEGETTVVTNSEQPTVTVDGTAYFSVVDIQNFHILGTGIESSGDLWLDNSMIRNNDTGLLSVAGRVTLRRSRVLGSLSVGIRLQGNQPVTLINSIVADGGFGPDPGGIVALGPSL